MKKYIIVYSIRFLRQSAAERLTISYIFYRISHRGYDYDEISCKFRWPPLERDDGLIEIRDVWTVALGMLRGVDLQKTPFIIQTRVD